MKPTSLSLLIPGWLIAATALASEQATSLPLTLEDKKGNSVEISVRSEKIPVLGSVAKRTIYILVSKMREDSMDLTLELKGTPAKGWEEDEKDNPKPVKLTIKPDASSPSPAEVTFKFKKQPPGSGTPADIYEDEKSEVKASVVLVPVEMLEVSFAESSYHELKSDDGNTTYNAPHWVDKDSDGEPEENDPVAFTRNTKPQLKAKFKAEGLPGDLSVKVRANSAQGLKIPETSATTEGGTIELPATSSSENLGDTIQFYNADENSAFTIDWEIRIGDGGWLALGSSRHTVYVTRAAPVKTAKNLMRETLFNIGCRNANGLGDDEQAVVDAIYSEFTDRDVQKAKPGSGSLIGYRLRYWEEEQAERFKTEDILESGDGKCGAWTKFFIDILRTQGIDAQIVNFQAPAPPTQNLAADIKAQFPKYGGKISSIKGLIYVKKWTLISDPFAPIDDFGIAAQGDPDPQAYFGDHSLVKYGGKLYDPSYGSGVFASQQEWEDAAIDAFGAIFIATPPLPNGASKWIWKADPKGSTETGPINISY